MKATSGKLLIVAMLGAGVLAAGASWWFRYTATHLAAQYWGPAAARLIRDAPEVELLALELKDGSAAKDAIIVAGIPWQIADSQDVSRAPGLTHLRIALLEDRSFVWPERAVSAQTQWTHGLRFRDDSATPLVILFSSDFGLAAASTPGGTAAGAVSCEPISEGLGEVFREWTRPAPDGR